jgi:CheY-like chemotaxis protein
MSRTLLIVDDDARFRRIAGTILAPRFTVVGEAASCREAMVRVGALRPEVVLLDVGLPDGDGFALAAELTAAPGGPAVVLTSSDDLADLAARGGRAFIPKDALAPEALARLLR